MLALVVLSFLTGDLQGGAATAQQAEPRSDGTLREVGKLPLYLGSGEGAVLPEEGESSGWLILSKKTRKGYQIFETGRGTTVIQSFNLDSLAPGRRAEFLGIPIAGGPHAKHTVLSTSGSAGEIIHAVDEEKGRVYFALTADETDFASGTGSSAGRFSSFFLLSPDGSRPVGRYVAIDEDKFDKGEANFAASFPEPAWPNAWLRALAVDRRSVNTENSFASLVAIVTYPSGVSNGAPPGIHRLIQWDVSDLTLGAPDPTGAALVKTTQPAPPPEAPPITLTVCGGSSMVTGDVPGVGNYRWGVLMAPDGVFLGCQTSANSSRAAFIGLTKDRLQTGVQLAYPLSRAVSDVFVDPGGDSHHGRLLFRSVGGGQTWWVFDTDPQVRRFVGAVAAMLGDSAVFSAGINETTGRMYMLVPDYPVLDPASHREFGVRGGLYLADTRLNPVPPAENVDPDMAYPGVFRIVVDDQTRRIFVRRGKSGANPTYEFPGTTPTKPAPIESHYLVLRDDRSIPEQVAEDEDADRRFTVNAREAEGVTKASYLGSGSAFGARSLLIGGFGAATDRTAAEAANTDCEKEDREFLAGQVESAMLSDVSASATAASLAADAKTEEQSGELLMRCWPSTREPPENVPPTDETDFDRTGKPDGKPDGQSDYRTECVADHDPDVQRPPDARFPGLGTPIPGSRAGFTADVDCKQPDEAVTAKARGALVTPGEFGDHTAPVVTVGHAESTVTVKRRDGGGVVVTVDSIVRDVTIEGIGHIGVVRSEATSEAAGRDGTARGTFTRTICGIDFAAPAVHTAGCLTDAEAESWARTVNTAMTGRMEVRVRKPEQKLLSGSPSGYRSGVQRRALELFQDSAISKDQSLALPGLELLFYRGDSVENGVGRQIVQLAGVQAGTSYGIACLFGGGRDGGCATGIDAGGGAEPPSFAPPTVGTDGSLTYASPPSATSTGKGGGIAGALTRLLKVPFELAADVLRLLFSNPREFGLMAAVWALVYLPCYLGERRRTLQGLASRRVVGGATS